MTYINSQLYACQTGVDKYAVFSLTGHAPLTSACLPNCSLPRPIPRSRWLSLTRDKSQIIWASGPGQDGELRCWEFGLGLIILVKCSQVKFQKRASCAVNSHMHLYTHAIIHLGKSGGKGVRISEITTVRALAHCRKSERCVSASLHRIP